MARFRGDVIDLSPSTDCIACDNLRPPEGRSHIDSLTSAGFAPPSSMAAASVECCGSRPAMNLRLSCGSQSTTRTRAPASDNPKPRFHAVVVLPVPPLDAATAICLCIVWLYRHAASL